ncbi:hypothetical protein PAMC26577_06340 [Caballeronia sordidicola]|uniref:Uncharacterized protein n=1 Tax=Caballeronia sordidicola TaxID=196367 RepID=A0A242N3U9_CABSO|nr:hypothetical protein PAMC26577_06340 [Caballeronia sordidicola]
MLAAPPMRTAHALPCYLTHAEAIAAYDASLRIEWLFRSTRTPNHTPQYQSAG